MDEPIKAPTPEEIASKREQLLRGDQVLRAEAWDWLKANAPLSIEECQEILKTVRRMDLKIEFMTRLAQLREALPPPPETTEPAPGANDKPPPKKPRRYEKSLLSPEEKKQRRESQSVKPHRLVMDKLSTFKEEEYEWLWPGRFPLGCLVALLGQMGLGKSTFLSWLAAQVTMGASWPDCPEKSEPGHVIYLQSEESVSKALCSRVRLFGGDPEKVHVVRGVNRGEAYDDWFDLGRDVARLAEACDGLDRKVRLVIIDPLLSFLPASNDHGGGDARRVLQPAIQFADDYRLTFLYSTHPNKDSEKSILDRMSGPGAYAQVARAAYFFSRDPNDTSRRMISLLKGNIRGLKRTTKSIVFDEARCKITWLSRESDLTAEDVNNLLLKKMREARAEGKRGPDPSEMKRAVAFLLEYLARGPVLQSVVQDQALNIGIKESSFRKAVKHLVTTEGSVKRARRDEDQRFELSLIATCADKDAPPPPPGNRAPES